MNFLVLKNKNVLNGTADGYWLSFAKYVLLFKHSIYRLLLRLVPLVKLTILQYFLVENYQVIVYINTANENFNKKSKNRKPFRILISSFFDKFLCFSLTSAEKQHHH